MVQEREGDDEFRRAQKARITPLPTTLESILKVNFARISTFEDAMDHHRNEQRNFFMETLDKRQGTYCSDWSIR